jgi:hypothetical protein
VGLFDKLKGIKNAAQAVHSATQPTSPAQPQAPHVDDRPAHHEAQAAAPHEQEAFDVAGFDPDNDEEAFFNAVLHMESEGMFGGTDESRAEIMARHGIRDRSHWQTVKESCYHVLARRYGSIEEAMQQEMNWRSGQMQRHMMQQQQQAAAGGKFDPVEGVTLEAWAALNAAIVGGGNAEDLIKGAGMDMAKWQRVSAEWNAAMARDTTFAITTVYGNAFQAASQGKYASFAREAQAARAANRDLSLAPPMPYEQYYRIMLEQAYGAKQGKDPVQTLKSSGLTIVDWTDLGAFYGYMLNRDAVRNWDTYNAIHQKLDTEFKAKNPGVDVDIAF